MFADRVKILLLIIIIAGLGAFYDFALFLDRYRLWLVSNPQINVPVVFYFFPFIAVSRNLLGLTGSVYAVLGFAGMFFRTARVHSLIIGLAQLNIGMAAVNFLLFGSISKPENGALYIIFSILAYAAFNRADVKKSFGCPEPPPSGAAYRFFSAVFNVNTLAIVLTAAYLTAAARYYEIPAKAVYPALSKVSAAGTYRTIFKYNVFVPAGYVMQSAVTEFLKNDKPQGASAFSNKKSVSAGREFICVLSKGGDRIYISDNCNYLMSELKNFALFFGLASEREFLKILVNERYGIIIKAIQKIFRSFFNREAETPYYKGFSSDGERPGMGSVYRSGHYFQFTLWANSAAEAEAVSFNSGGPDCDGGLGISFNASAGAFDRSLMETVISTIRPEDRLKSSVSYFDEGLELYKNGDIEGAKFSFANSIYYNYANYGAHYYLARCFYESGRTDSAIIFHLNAAISNAARNGVFAGADVPGAISRAGEIAPAFQALGPVFNESAPSKTGFFY
ncbi:MAG TPA: hypothetical protein PKW98_12510 [Candidatus Wallbacteria bacterium]|nr:MAG: hypothetical protein BWY32_03213 [bacterium ADurb.Bin243]HOD42191.1 hypothetical protein [Candidatus Wallbacteria bacterium]HPG58631.1 hypothetical protein [Candidatus Wallbacteria bacterium]